MFSLLAFVKMVSPTKNSSNVPEVNGRWNKSLNKCLTELILQVFGVRFDVFLQMEQPAVQWRLRKVDRFYDKLSPAHGNRFYVGGTTRSYIRSRSVTPASLPAHLVYDATTTTTSCFMTKIHQQICCAAEGI